MSPRILCWNLYYPPDSAATSLLLAELVDRLHARGDATVVVHGNPSYRPTSHMRWRPWQLAQRVNDNVVVRSTRRSRDRLRSRLANYLSFVGLSAPVAAATRTDAILVMSDPPILVMAAVVLGRLRRRPVVYWLQDYHPEFLVGIGSLQPTRVVRMWSRLHRAAMRRCDIVIAIGRDMAQRVEEAGVDPARVRVVPNGSAVDWDTERVAESASSRPFHALHAGEIGMRGAWRAMVDGARDAADVATVVFLGDGVEAPAVRRMAADAANVEFEERLPHDQLPRRLAEADVLLVTVGRGAEGYSVPSKTYELFGCGKPIVVIADAMTESARLVTELDCGLVVSPDDGQEFADALRLLAGDADLRTRLGANALKARDLFRRSDCLDLVVDILHEVITPDA